MIGRLTEEQIDEVLKENVLGRIGCNDGKNHILYSREDGVHAICVAVRSHVSPAIAVMFSALMWAVVPYIFRYKGQQLIPLPRFI